MRSLPATALLLAATLLPASSALAQMMEGDGAADALQEELPVAISGDPSGERGALTADEIKFFESKIRPLLITHCYGCHSKSANASKGGLRLDTRESTLRGGKSGPAVVPADLDSSLLIRAVRYHDVDFQMPPDARISDAEIALLEKWVEMGAPDPRVDKPAAAGGASPGTEHRWTAEDIDRGRAHHWAYQPVAAPTAPTVADPAWGATAIDSFLIAAMIERGLTPAAPADKRTLLRRASFDLTGLPPSEADLAAFERDASTDAFAKAVDRLLASPTFGERWGRHWLDVARYAESSGKETNLVYPHAWRYRDYVIDAFNEDKPYDRFLVEQLAGDLLPASSDADRAEHIVATGYLALGTKSHNARGKPQFQMDLADEQLDAATQGMLGLTVACARCHDHKFDPITQKDYYAVAGIFLSTDTRFGTFEGQQNNHATPLIELPRESGMAAGPTMRPEQRSVLAALKTRTEEEAERAAEVIAQAREARQAGRDLPANIQQQIVRARATQGAVRNLESMTSRFDERGEPTGANMIAMGAVDRDRALKATELAVELWFDAPLSPVGRLGVAVRRLVDLLVTDGDIDAARLRAVASRASEVSGRPEAAALVRAIAARRLMEDRHPRDAWRSFTDVAACRADRTLLIEAYGAQSDAAFEGELTLLLALERSDDPALLAEGAALRASLTEGTAASFGATSERSRQIERTRPKTP